MASERTDPEADRPGPGSTPEGHTPEKPAAEEVSDSDESSEMHADEAEPLGPIDWQAWGASLLGIAVAALIGLALALPNLPR